MPIGRTSKKIEMAANIAIVLAAVVLIVSFFRSESVAPPHITVGTKFALKDAPCQGQGKNLVLALSTSCHFCNDSAPFYRELVQRCRQQHVRTIAVLPQPIAEAESYLSSEGVATDEVHQSVLRELQIAGTPTLLLVDGSGVVRNVWVGKLSSDKEKEVLAALES